MRRRRFEGSEEEERDGLRADAAEAVPLVVTGGWGALEGEACRLVEVDGWTRRVSGLFAIVVEGPAFPERGWSGFGAPVVELDREGKRWVLLLSKEGS